MVTFLLLIALSLDAFAQDYRPDLSSWCSSTIHQAKSASSSLIGTKQEQDVIFYCNLARLDGRLFAKTILLPYLQAQGDTDLTDFYISSLIDDLNRLPQLKPLQRSRLLTKMARDYAITSGNAGIVGHSNFDQRFASLFHSGWTIGENCAYMQSSALNTVMDLLVDEGIPSLGLQNLFFNYLNKLDKEHGFQLFVTSHSPTITAKADLKSVIVLQNEQSKIQSLAIRDSGLTAPNLNYLEKFLDVTKSQLFFSNGIILVEGISEALLMKIFSLKVGDTYDIEKAGIETVNIGGVAFEHFANLFNNAETTKNLKIRCSLITDDDRKEIADNPAARIANINLMQGGTLKTFIGVITFEYELFLASETNRTLLLKVYNEFHPQTEIEEGANAQEYSKAR